MYTSRFSFGHGQTDPITGADLLGRYVTIVDHGDDASHDSNTKRMFQLWGEEFSFPYSEEGWAQLDSHYRDGWTEHLRIEFTAVISHPPVVDNDGDTWVWRGDGYYCGEADPYTQPRTLTEIDDDYGLRNHYASVTS